MISFISLQNEWGVRVISEVVSCGTVLNWPQVLGRTGKFRAVAELQYCLRDPATGGAGTHTSPMVF